MTSREQVNIVSAEFKANPFPFLATLRASEPVFRTTLPDKAKTPVWLITRYADVNALLRDQRFAKNRRKRPDTRAGTKAALGAADV